MRRYEAGMTLVEVMLVLFIIGLASTVVVLTLPPQESPARQAASDLTRMLQTAQDRAILTGSSIGVHIDDRTIGTSVWRGDDWRKDRQTLDLPRGTSLRLLDVEPAEDESDTPAIVFDQTGVNADLSFRIDGRSEDIDLMFSASGEVHVETR